MQTIALRASLLVAASLAFALPSGCGEALAPTPADRLADEWETTSASACACWMTLGYPSEEACATEPDAPAAVSDEERACLDTLYTDLEDDTAAEVQAALDCWLDVQAQLNACIEGLACDDGAWTQCLDDFGPDGSALAMCPELPDTAEDAFEACF